MKLSHRLDQIVAMVEPRYAHIWDCCCDHGFLGAKLLQLQPSVSVHFVDIVDELMIDLTRKLARFYPRDNFTWSTHCLDVSQLPLGVYQGSHLVVIAGVGADLMCRFIADIIRRYPLLTIDFLLCPVNGTYQLRQTLIAHRCVLQHEIIIEDKRRFYEALLVSTQHGQGKSVNAVGERLWQAQTEKGRAAAQQYLLRLLSHYRRVQCGTKKDVSHIIDAYSAVVLT